MLKIDLIDCVIYSGSVIRILNSRLIMVFLKVSMVESRKLGMWFCMNRKVGIVVGSVMVMVVVFLVILVSMFRLKLGRIIRYISMCGVMMVMVIIIVCRLIRVEDCMGIVVLVVDVGNYGYG